MNAKRWLTICPCPPLPLVWPARVTQDSSALREASSPPDSSLPASSHAPVATRTVELVLANCAYHYEVIRHAAREVQAMPAFVNHPLVRGLLFSNKWIGGFLRRHDMKRRRNSATDKVRPSPAAIQAQMELIQKFVIEHNLQNGDIVNMDETGIRYGAKPLHQFVVRGAKRGSVPDADEKARFTEVMAGDGAGSMLPTMGIIKCSCAKPNMRNIRVLANLHNKAGFTEQDGWTKHVWTRKLTLKARTTHTVGGKKINKGDLFEQEYTRPYLFHQQTGTVFTAQVKAWMGTDIYPSYTHTLSFTTCRSSCADVRRRLYWNGDVGRSGSWSLGQAQAGGWWQ